MSAEEADDGFAAEYLRAKAVARRSAAKYLAALDSDGPELPRLADVAAGDASYVAGLARHLKRRQ